MPSEDQRADVRTYVSSAGETGLEDRLTLKHYSGFSPYSNSDPETRRFLRGLGAHLAALRVDGIGFPRGATHYALKIILRDIEEYYSQPSISLASIQDEIHLSARHLGRLFQRATGQTFRSYLGDARIRHALSILVGGRQPIKAVGELVGYSSKSQFYHEFRTRVGCTPAEWVRRRIVCESERR